MSYFEAKMHQISISAGALPQTPLGEGGKGERSEGLEPPPLQISGYATVQCRVDLFAFRLHVPLMCSFNLRLFTRERLPSTGAVPPPSFDDLDQADKAAVPGEAADHDKIGRGSGQTWKWVIFRDPRPPYVTHYTVDP